MKSKTSRSKTSAGGSERRNRPSPKVRVIRATAIGAIAGGLVGAAIAKRKSPAISRTTRKLKDWGKTAARSPVVKSLVAGAAQRVVAVKPSKVATGTGPRRRNAR